VSSIVIGNLLVVAFYRFDSGSPRNSSVAVPMSLRRETCPNCVDFTIWGPIAREDLPGLCDRVCTLLTESGGGDLRCDVDGVEADAVTVDALARLQLAARRQGCRIELRNASRDLLELVAFMGLRDVLTG
jgi:ABC-type transporter Mla MlaB component